MLASTSRILLPTTRASTCRSAGRAVFPALIRLSSSAAAFDDNGPTSQQSASVRTRLLLECLPLVPTYGFTRHAFLSQTSTPSSASLSDKEDSGFVDRTRVLNTLFPGPASVFESELFQAWNRVHDLQAIYQTSAEDITQQLWSGDHPSLRFDGTDAGRTKVEMRASLSEEETRKALLNVQQVVEDRLRSYWDIRQHLIHGITVFSSYSVSMSRMHSILPHNSILPSLPDPTAMLGLCSDFVSSVLTDPAAQTRTGWLDADSTDWYSVRARLISAYLLTTLHISSGQIGDFADSQRFFRRIMAGRDSGVAATLESAIKSRNEWIEWGGRGWVGVLRSLGL